jgi:hypothetical protein
MKNILFYNLWHNGDVFSGRGYIKHIIDSLPDVKFGYYHKNNKKIVSDLCRMQFSPELKKWEIDKLNFRKIYETESTIYINTWVGTYFHQNIERMLDHQNVIINLPNEGHANYRSLHLMYDFIIKQLNASLGTDIKLSNDPLEYIPEINWSAYDTDTGDAFVMKHKTKRKHLFCNGDVRSNQSVVGDMSQIISALATEFNNDVFICTQKFDSNLPNIYFTSDIFKCDNDLNEIAYLSTWCSTIIGKNSGPFMFTHVKKNIYNSYLTFVAFSNHISDCYPHHINYLPCRYLFSNTNDRNQVYKISRAALTNNTILSI